VTTWTFRTIPFDEDLANLAAFKTLCIITTPSVLASSKPITDIFANHFASSDTPRIFLAGSYSLAHLPLLP